MCIKIKCKHIKDDGTECGHKNSIFASFCGGCGAPLNYKHNVGLLLAIVCSLLVVGGGIGIFLVEGNDGGNDNNPIPQFEIIVKSDNPNLGTVTGGCQADSLAIVTIKAEAKEGCQFVKWNDGNKDSIRKVVADSDKEYIAIFEACNRSVHEPDEDNENPVTHVTTPKVPQFKISVVSLNPDKGMVSGSGTYDSLASVTIEAIACDGCRFVKWNDGNKEKSRKVIILRDQTFSAEFEKVALPPVEKPGKCKIQYSFGRYEGDCKNGIPEGEGTMYYDCRVQIAKHDADNPAHYAEAGDRFVGSWGNGDIVVGVLYGKDGNAKERIFAPKRFNPYDLNRDKCVQ